MMSADQEKDDFAKLNPVGTTKMGEFIPSPHDKILYSNVLSIGMSANDVTIDFGILRRENVNSEIINVPCGQVAVIMTHKTATLLKDTLETVLKHIPTA